MKQTGLADSPFFQQPVGKDEVFTPPAISHPVKEKTAHKINKQKTKQGGDHDTTKPRHHDPVIPRYHDTMTPRIYGVEIEVVRKAVKEFGKEAATHRFTEAEKKEIADLIYTYKNRGIKTSENEITRIAVNFLFEDYRANGENSVLHSILSALNE